MPEAEGDSFQRLPDDAVVVRGGLMSAADLSLGAQTHFDAEGAYALSVCSVPGRLLTRSREAFHSRTR